MVKIGTPTAHCTIGDLNVGDRYIDNGGDVFVIVNIHCDLDEFRYAVNINSGRVTLISEKVILTKSVRPPVGKLVVSAFLNGWSEDPTL